MSIFQNILESNEFVKVKQYPELQVVSEIFDVPKNLMLAIIYAEDLRFNRTVINDICIDHISWTYIKSYLRPFVPEMILNILGHPEHLKNSQLGLPHHDTILHSIRYLVLRSSNFAKQYVKYHQKSRNSMLKKYTIRDRFKKWRLSRIASLAIHLRALHLVWLESGWSLKRFKDDLPYQSEAIWATLYNIAIIKMRYRQFELKPILFSGQRVIVPKSNPKTGGATIINCLNFGELVRALMMIMHRSNEEP
jgi:hypothetical protein